jgi:hypothetical protein
MFLPDRASFDLTVIVMAFALAHNEPYRLWCLFGNLHNGASTLTFVKHWSTMQLSAPPCPLALKDCRLAIAGHWRHRRR